MSRARARAKCTSGCEHRPPSSDATRSASRPAARDREHAAPDRRGRPDRGNAWPRRLREPRFARLPAPEKPYSEFLRRRVIPIVDVGLVAAVKNGAVKVVPGLERFAGRHAGPLRRRRPWRSTGSSRRPASEPVSSRSSDTAGVLDAAGVPLVHGPDEHPTAPGLHFVGYLVTLGGTLQLAGKQAERLARIAA